MGPEETQGEDFSAEDLAHLKSEEGDDKGADKTQDAASTEDADADKGKVSHASDDDGDKGSTLATGADSEDDKKAEEKRQEETAASKAEQVKQLREQIATYFAAGDKKVYKQELRRLERLGIDDPAKLYGLWREAEGKLTSGGLIKVPGKDAKEEEVKAFQKALGWAEKPEEMFKEIKLENDAVIGEADRPMMQGFLEAVHGATSAQDYVNKAANWYYKTQEDAAAQLDESDDAFRRESETALKDDLGPAFKRKINAIATLFASTPGGADDKNEGSLFHRVVHGRTADGRLIGDDPDVTRFLIGLVDEVNPMATVVEDGAGAPGAQARLDEIRALRKTDKRKYYSEPIQQEELRLIAALEKNQNRARS